MSLTARGRRSARRSTEIPVDAPTESEREALKKAAERVYLREQAKFVLAEHAVEKPHITVRDFLRWYERHVTAHHKGRDRERSMLRALTAALGPLPLGELTRDRILEWRTARAGEVSHGSVNRELDVLKAALAKAVPKYLAASPAAGIPRLPHRAAAPAILSREDEATILAALPDARDRAVIIAAVDTLIRAGDLVRLSWSDDHGTYLSVRDPKGGRPYDVPISRRLRVALDALPRDGGLMFPHRQSANGRPLELWRMLREACLRTGIAAGRAAGGLTFHALRHTGASRLVAAGVDLRTVQTLGGWASLRHLERYSHPTHAHFQAAVDAIGAGVSITSPSRDKSGPTESG